MPHVSRHMVVQVFFIKVLSVTGVVSEICLFRESPVSNCVCQVVHQSVAFLIIAHELNFILVEFVSSLLLEALLGGDSSGQALSLLVNITTGSVELKSRVHFLLLAVQMSRFHSGWS